MEKNTNEENGNENEKDDDKDVELPEGIFIGEKPLMHYLEDLVKEKVTEDVGEIVGEETDKKTTTRRRAYKPKYAEETRRVRKRVRRFTDREIRKEYGIMQKPFASNSENIIWVIMEKGPVSVSQINKEMGNKMKENSASAAVATVWSRLGNAHTHAADIISRQMQPNTNTYFYQKKIGVDCSVEAAIEKFKIAGQKQYKDKVRKQKEAKAAKEAASKSGAAPPDDQQQAAGPGEKEDHAPPDKAQGPVNGETVINETGENVEELTAADNAPANGVNDVIDTFQDEVKSTPVKIEVQDQLVGAVADEIKKNGLNINIKADITFVFKFGG